MFTNDQRPESGWPHSYALLSGAFAYARQQDVIPIASLFKKQGGGQPDTAGAVPLVTPRPGDSCRAKRCRKPKSKLEGGFQMRNRLTRLIIALVAIHIFSSVLFAQADAQSGRPNDQQAERTAPVPDLSGFWTIQGREQIGPQGSNRPGDVPMTAWAEARYEAARPPFGEKQTFVNTTDPVQKYCDPPGVTRLYNYPWQFAVLQTPDVVYILFEFTRVWRSVAMDRDHPKDPDSTWLGDSIGGYEGETLVVDTIGFNDKTWLDNAGHPHSDALHLVERLRRVNHDTLEVDLTFDDSKAFTRSWGAKLQFKRSSSPMGETLCSMSEMEAFRKNVIEPTTTPPPRK
jgi:hypothetical protein